MKILHLRRKEETQPNMLHVRFSFVGLVLSSFLMILFYMSTLQGCFYRRRTFSTFSNCQYILIVSGISLDIECQLILMKTVLLSGILDLPAKAQLMEMNQYTLKHEIKAT